MIKTDKKKLKREKGIKKSGGGKKEKEKRKNAGDQEKKLEKRSLKEKNIICDVVEENSRNRISLETRL